MRQNHRWKLGLPQNMTVCIPDELLSVKYVFVRHDGHLTPLQRPYDGSHKVILPGSKTFRIRVGNREEIIAIDPLKTDHTDTDTPVTVAHPPCRGRPPAITSPRGKLIRIYLQTLTHHVLVDK